MTDTPTTHVAEVAVPGQAQVTVRLAHGEYELGQEYDHEHHSIYVQPDNVLRLVRAMLVMVGLEDAYLYTQRPGGLCNDLDWPEGPFSRREVAMMNARPDINWQAALEDFDETGSEVSEHVTLKERRARVAKALKADPTRSNRSIAGDCGVSDKTVAAVRAEIAEQGAEVEPNSAEFRRGDEQFRLIAAE